MISSIVTVKKINFRARARIKVCNNQEIETLISEEGGASMIAYCYNRRVLEEKLS